MRVATLRRDYRFTSAIFLVILFLIALNFKSYGPLEGHQRIRPSDQSLVDWWGPLPPILYGNWPSSSNDWLPTLAIFQSLLFILGMYLCWRFSLNGKVSKWMFLMICLLGGIFTSQLWRDCSLLAFVILGMGILSTRNSQRRRAIRISLFVLGNTLIIFGLSFKYISAFAIVPLILFFESLSLKYSKKRLFVSYFVIVLSAVMVSFGLGKVIDLKRTFPEQQPMFYDLASLYCWSDGAVSVKAELVLREFKRDSIPSPAICASLEPIGWDTLHQDRPKWEYSSPIKPVTHISDFDKLRASWITIISRYPFEYLQAKWMNLSQLLVMANSIGPRNFLATDNIVETFALIPVKLTISIVSGIDKLRLFSPVLPLIIILVAIYRASRRESHTFSAQSQKSKNLFRLLTIWLAELLVSSISFVSANGRYIFPATVIFLICYFGVNSPSTSRNQPST